VVSLSSYTEVMPITCEKSCNV